MSENRSFFAELKRRNVYEARRFSAMRLAPGSGRDAGLSLSSRSQTGWCDWSSSLRAIGFPSRSLRLGQSIDTGRDPSEREMSVARSAAAHRKVALGSWPPCWPWPSVLFHRPLHSSHCARAGWHRHSRQIDRGPAIRQSQSRSRQRFFAEGVQDEILTRLAKVADLKVIARTSTQKFKSAPENLPDIAKQLGVANILEGSVQKANDQVRVNVQLINALTNAHLWAEIYDRKLTDIFAVESDIAKTIADTLQAKLTGSEKQLMASQPTTDTNRL